MEKTTDDLLAEVVMLAITICADARDITRTRKPIEGAALGLAEAFTALHERLRNGAPLPKDWQPEAVAARRRAAFIEKLKGGSNAPA